MPAPIANEEAMTPRITGDVGISFFISGSDIPRSQQPKQLVPFAEFGIVY